MNTQYLLPVRLMLAAAAIALLAGGFAWRRRSLPGGWPLFWLMIAAAVFSVSSAAELLSTSREIKILWAQFSYLGITSIPPLWLMFSISYFRLFRSGLTRRRLAALWLIPMITLVLASTNQWHGLIWPTITPVSSLSGSRLVYEHGIAFWVYAIFAYILLIIGTYILLRYSRNSPQLIRKQANALVIAALIPWAGNLLYLINLSPWPGFDPTTITFGPAGLLIAWNLFRLRLLELLPVAREILFDKLGDGVLVLDDQDRILDLNPIARRWTGLGSESIGRNINEVIGHFENVTQLVLPDQGQVQLEIGEKEDRRVFSLLVTPLGESLVENNQTANMGRIVLIHDITQERVMLDSAQRHSRQTDMLYGITRAALNPLDMQTTLQTLTNLLGELFNADAAFLTVWDMDQHRVKSSTAFGALGFEFQDIKFNPDGLPLINVVMNSESYIAIGDAMNLFYIGSITTVSAPIGSILTLPLFADNRKIGAAGVSFKQQHHFTPEELSLGEQAASQIAVALLNIRLIESEKRRSAQMTALQSVSRIVASSLQLQEIMESVVNLLHDTFGYSLVSIYLVDGDVLRLGAQVGYMEEKIYREIPITQGVLGRTVRTKQVNFIQDVFSDPEFLRVSSDITSEISVPLMKEDKVLGGLNVESTSEGKLTEEDVNLLITFAHQVAVAIDNANLFQAEHSQRQVAEALFAATRDFSTGLGEEAVLLAVVEHIIHALGVVGCTISRWDPVTDCVITLIDHTTVPDASTDVPGTSYPLANYPATRSVIVNRQPAFLRLDNPTIDPAERATLQRFKNETVLILPLASSQSGEVFGIVELFNKLAAPPILGSRLELAQSLLAQAAAAIENARLYAKVQRLSILDELTGLQNRRGLFEIGRREFERAERFFRPLSVLFLDLDHFKIFNDQYSYAVGDETLRLVAKCLIANLREIDLAGRYGGEEFVVLLPETDLASAVSVAQRLRHSIELTKVRAGQDEVGITVSIGVCQKTPELLDLDALIDRAGLAVHEAKKNGRNRVSIAPLAFQSSDD